MFREFNIKGHSGCDIKIKKNKVVKLASDSRYSDRLFLQHNKQMQFKNKNIFLK